MPSFLPLAELNIYDDIGRNYFYSAKSNLVNLDYSLKTQHVSAAQSLRRVTCPQRCPVASVVLLVQCREGGKGSLPFFCPSAEMIVDDHLGSNYFIQMSSLVICFILVLLCYCRLLLPRSPISHSSTRYITGVAASRLRR